MSKHQSLIGRCLQVLIVGDIRIRQVIFALISLDKEWQEVKMVGAVHCAKVDQKAFQTEIANVRQE